MVTPPLYAAVLTATQQLFPAVYAHKTTTLPERYRKFECLTWVMSYVLYQLKQQGDTGAGQAQLLVECMLDDLADNLREQGVSDMRVGPELRKLAAAFNGRAQRYQPLWRPTSQAAMARLMATRLSIEATAAQVLIKRLRAMTFPLPAG